MTNNRTGQLAIWPLIKVPAIITLAVTILRLTGELEHWSRTFVGQPGGDNALIGITWLAPLFGIYFSIRLVRAGQGPSSSGRALGYSMLGALVAVVGMTLMSGRPAGHFHTFLLRIWGLSVIAAVVTIPAWRDLFRVQLAYAYSARIPTAIIMLFAIRGNWGTHYDIAPGNVTFLNYFTKYLWIGFFAQLVFWVGFTMVSGMLSGTVAAAIMRWAGRAPEPDKVTQSV